MAEASSSSENVKLLLREVLEAVLKAGVEAAGVKAKEFARRIFKRREHGHETLDLGNGRTVDVEILITRHQRGLHTRVEVTAKALGLEGTSRTFDPKDPKERELPRAIGLALQDLSNKLH